MNIKNNNIKKIYLINNKLIDLEFNILNKSLILINKKNKNLIKLNFNYFHYKGFISSNNKFLFFKNKKSLMMIIKRITNLIKGFLKGFCLILEIIGLGFSVTNNNNILRFNIGFNHSIFYKIPNNVIICSKRKFLFLFSYSFFDLKNTVTDIKNFRKLNIYKLKGIKEKNELYVKKN